jgi:anti-repressor protein
MNNELINIIYHNDIQVVDARSLHEVLESKQQFTDWIKNRIEKYDFEEGKSYFINLCNRSDGLSGKPRQEYLLTISTAKEIAMVENSEMGRKIRLYFIQIEQRYIAEQNNPEIVLAKALIVANQTINSQRQQIEQQKEKLAIAEPKAEYFDKYSEHDHLTGLTETAKMLRISRTFFIEELIAKGYLYRGARGLLPCSKKEKYFETKAVLTKNNRAETQTFITVIGKKHFSKIFSEELF